MENNKIRFWRSKLTNRTTNTGINENVNFRKNPYVSTEKYIKQLEATITENSKSTIMDSDDYYKSVVFNCINRLKENKRGYVFNECQVRDVLLLYKGKYKLKFVHNYYDNIWYVYPKKTKENEK